MARVRGGLMDRQRLELRKNAYDAFVTVPRMGPRLVYRYLFDAHPSTGIRPFHRPHY